MGTPEDTGLISQNRVRQYVHTFFDHDRFTVGKEYQSIGNRLDILDRLEVDENFLIIQLSQKYQGLAPLIVAFGPALDSVLRNWQRACAYGTVLVLIESTIRIEGILLCK